MSIFVAVLSTRSWISVVFSSALCTVYDAGLTEMVFVELH